VGLRMIAEWIKMIIAASLTSFGLIFMLPIMDSYNVRDGKFSDDIVQSYSQNGFSTHLARAEQRQNINTKLPEGELIIDI
jgi:hypothetical protein